MTVQVFKKVGNRVVRCGVIVSRRRRAASGPTHFGARLTTAQLAEIFKPKG